MKKKGRERSWRNTYRRSGRSEHKEFLGKSLHSREEAFAYAGLDWKEYVRIDPKYFRPMEVGNLIGYASKPRTLLSWEPNVTFRELARIMGDADLEAVSSFRITIDKEQIKR